MDNRKNGFTKRAFILGGLLSLFIAVTDPYLQSRVWGTRLTFDFYTPYAILLLFIFVIGINPLLKMINKNYGLSAQELLTISIMMIVACSITSLGLTLWLLPALVSPFYYATPENRWQELLQPHIRSWMVPQNPLTAKYFYEGLPEGMGIPWKDWIFPLLNWSIFIFALYFVMICVMSILRKQWVENEKLVYPLAKFPVEMVKENPGSIFPSLFKSKLLWLGFFITFILGAFSGLHYYFPAFPRMSQVTHIPIFRQSVNLEFRLSFPMIGFTYFIPTNLSLSIWFFSLMLWIEKGLANIIGFDIKQIADPWTGYSTVIAGHRAIGAYLVLVVSGLWIARRHLKEVFLKAIGKGNIDDSGELLSYPLSFWGMVSGLIFIGIWLRFSGMPGVIIPIFLFVAFVFFIGVSRTVAEGGLPLLRIPSPPSFFAISGFGTGLLGPAGLTSMAFTWIWAADNSRVLLMACVGNGLKMSEGRKKLHPLFFAIIIAIVIAFAGSIWMTLRCVYSSGAINMHHYFTWAPRIPFDFAARYIQNPAAPNPGGWLWTGIGAGIMWLLTFLHYRFIWWPFHPLGFAIAPCSMVLVSWFSIFISWLIKVSVLRFGGIKLYRTLFPIFFGLIIGQFAVSGLWLVVDLFAGAYGNLIFAY